VLPPPALRAREACLLVVGLALLVLVSPLRLLWAHDGSHWLVPFGLWLVILIFGGLATRPRGES